VLVREDQLSLAIGRRGQNVRLGSKLCGWDIEIMTREELDEEIERAVSGFSALEGVDDTLAEKLVGEGFLSYDDLSVIEPDALMEMGGLTAEQVDKIVAQAEVKALEAEAAAAEERRRQRERERIEAATAAAEAEHPAESPNTAASDVAAAAEAGGSDGAAIGSASTGAAVGDNSTTASAANGSVLGDGADHVVHPEAESATDPGAAGGEGSSPG
jgi:N utilization substance protein A